MKTIKTAYTPWGIGREGARDGNPGFAPTYTPIFYTPWI